MSVTRPKAVAKTHQVGSADPPWPPLATAFVWVSVWWVLMSDRSVPGLGWSVWSGLWASFCMCDAALDILCNCVVSFVCFFSIPGMGACNSRITKTHGNG